MKRFLQLSRIERNLLLQAAFSILAVRFALRFLSFERLREMACRWAGRATTPFSSDRIVWAVESAARNIPASSCLTEALAAQALLVRYGYHPRLTIGVMKNERRSFVAHAWVTCEEQIVIGGAEVERYTSLLNLGSLP